MNHKRKEPKRKEPKRKEPKARRAGCLLCKPSKLNANKTADRMKARREWRRLEGLN